MARLAGLPRPGGRPGPFPQNWPPKPPRHIGIIMDGNGRWARRQGRPASFGHRAGVRAIKVVLQACEDLGVHVLSIYAFSTENWARPRAEVRALMRLFHETMQREIDEMHRRGVRIVVSGRREELSPRMRERIDEAMSRTANNTKDRKSTRLNSSHGYISYAVFCLKKKKNAPTTTPAPEVTTSTAVVTVAPIGATTSNSHGTQNDQQEIGAYKLRIITIDLSLLPR